VLAPASSSPWLQIWEELGRVSLPQVAQLAPHQSACSGTHGVAKIPGTNLCCSCVDAPQWFNQCWIHNGDFVRRSCLLELSITNPTQEGNALWFKPIRNNDSGIYFCKIREEVSCFKIIIEVEAKSQARCLDYGTNTLSLITGKGDSISCPGLKCYSHLNRSQVTWFKTFRLSLKLKGDKINLLTIYDKDAGVYVCDYMLFVNNTRWTVRTVVKVNVIVLIPFQVNRDFSACHFLCFFFNPGKPFEMECKVQFGYERDFIPMITWSRHSQEGKKTVIHIAKLREVTERDLNSNFTCIAQNSVGKSTGVIKLKRKEKVHFLYILSGLISMLLGLLVSSAFIYLHWIEIVLMYRNYLVKDETIGDHKEFDAFVSYAKMNSFESYSSFVNEEQFALDVLPEVLEKKHGYKLCLLERDILPGGAYTDDVVTAIKQSRRAIIILSPSYVNGPSIFELQAAVSCALEDSRIKLVLIKFQAFQEPDYLPPVVKKALRILPVITWKPSNWNTANKKFWKNIQYYMPVKNTEGDIGIFKTLSNFVVKS
uniref:Interleukin 18 receptor accessory protein n=1 Tax=Crocodylus porosus TaxID=8502 RepID=A0A7M4F8C8_CROPO